MSVLLRNNKKLGIILNIKSGAGHGRAKFTVRSSRLQNIKKYDKYFNPSYINQCNRSRRYLPIRNLTPVTILNSFVNEYYNREFALQYRQLHLSRPLNQEKPSSKVEATVQNLKDKQKEKDDLIKKETILSGETETNVTQQEKPVVKKRLIERIKDEITHYYHGFRLLIIDISICAKLIWRVLNGNKLNRRENRLLVRTTSDLFRLVPFSIFIIIPFMELLLPVFIKFFPGMLPSTFLTSKDRENKLKQSLQVKLEVAKFLQKTLDEMAVQHIDHKSEEAKQFSVFFKKIKNSNELISSDEIIKFSKNFEDEAILDSLARELLIALCRIMDMNTIGTTNFLRFQIRMKLRSLSADDKLIQRESIDSLNLFELQQACRSRGMRAYGLSEERLRNQLQEWINLSINEKVPPTLLLLSRALAISDHIATTDKLKATISALPETVATQAKAAIGEREGKVDNKTRIEIIKEEERKIKEERKEEEAVQKDQEKKKLREQAEILVDKAPVIDTSSSNVLLNSTNVKEGISSEDVEVLGKALETISSDKKKLLVEKETIKDLKEEIEDYKEDVEELKEITVTSVKEELKETRGAKILLKKVDKMVNQLDSVLKDLEKKEQAIRKDIANAAENQTDAEKKDKLVRIDELIDVIKKFQSVSDDARLKTIESVLSKIDDDKDGQIKVDDVLKVVEVIGKENVNLSERQLDELIELLDKEEVLEAETKIEKAIAKSLKEAKVSNDQLQDKAPIIEDKAEELIGTEEKHILNKTETKQKKVRQEKIPVQSATIITEGKIDKGAEILKNSTPKVSSLPPIATPTKIKSKDKML